MYGHWQERLARYLEDHETLDLRDSENEAMKPEAILNPKSFTQLARELSDYPEVKALYFDGNRLGLLESVNTQFTQGDGFNVFSAINYQRQAHGQIKYNPVIKVFDELFLNLTHLETLSLNNVNFSQRESEQFFDLLANARIKHLYYDGNIIGLAGMKRLAHYLMNNPSLETLSLRHTQLNNELFELLVNTLGHNNRLQRLIVSDNGNITDHSAVILKTKLETLELSTTGPITKTFQANTTLTSVRLKHTGVSHEVQDSINTLCELNKERPLNQLLEKTRLYQEFWRTAEVDDAEWLTILLGCRCDYSVRKDKLRNNIEGSRQVIREYNFAVATMTEYVRVLRNSELRDDVDEQAIIRELRGLHEEKISEYFPNETRVIRNERQVVIDLQPVIDGGLQVYFRELQYKIQKKGKLLKAEESKLKKNQEKLQALEAKQTKVLHTLDRLAENQSLPRAYQEQYPRIRERLAQVSLSPDSIEEETKDTLAHRAVQHNSHKVLAVLLEHEADILVCNRRGKTIWQLALLKPNSERANLLAIFNNYVRERNVEKIVPLHSQKPVKQWLRINKKLRELLNETKCFVDNYQASLTEACALNRIWGIILYLRWWHLSDRIKEHQQIYIKLKESLVECDVGIFIEATKKLSENAKRWPLLPSKLHDGLLKRANDLAKESGVTPGDPEEETQKVLGHTTESWAHLIQERGFSNERRKGVKEKKGNGNNSMSMAKEEMELSHSI